MNVLTTIPNESVPAWQARVDLFNSGSGVPPVTIEGFAQIFRDEQTARYVAAKKEADKLALASNDRLMALGKLVMQQPDKLDAVEAAVMDVLAP